LGIKAVFNRTKGFVTEQPIWLAILVVAVIMSLMSPDFGQFSNLINISNQAAMYGILGLGMTMILINGNIDLSVGNALGFSVMVCIFTIQQTESVLLALILTIVSGLLLGFINGFFVAHVGITSFVVTLASMIGIKGFTFIICKEWSIPGTSEAFKEFGETVVLGIPIHVIIFIILVVLMQWILSFTRHGRESFVIGGNLEAAFNAGLNVKRHILINFMISGLFVGICAILTASRINGATPTLGYNYQTMVIVAIVIGGTRLSGGYGSMVRTAAGALMISVLQNSLNMLGFQSYWSQLIVSDRFVNKGRKRIITEDRKAA
jgi:ribose transport system permease protein